MFTPLNEQIDPICATAVSQFVTMNLPERLTLSLMADDPSLIDVDQQWLTELEYQLPGWPELFPQVADIKTSGATMVKLVNGMREWYVSLIKDADILRLVENCATIGQVERRADQLMDNLWAVRQDNGGCSYRETVLHMLGIERRPVIDLVVRDGTSLWNNGKQVGWLAKKTLGAGYVLSVDGWYWRGDQPNQDRGGSTCRRVDSVTAGMAVAQELLVPGSGQKMGVVMQM